MKTTTILLCACFTLTLSPQARAGEKLFVAKPLTKPGEFTGGIEGPACDKKGNIYAVNFGKQGTVGQVTPQGKGEVFITLPGDSVGNGIRFDRNGAMFIADYVITTCCVSTRKPASCPCSHITTT